MYRFVGKKGKCYDLDSLKKVAMKLNYRCPKGKFVPDSFSCGDTPEEAKKNYESLHPESGVEKVTKSKTSTKKPSTLSSTRSRIASSEEMVIDLTKSNDKLLATIKNSKDQEEIKKLQRIVEGNNKSIEYFKNKIKTSLTQVDTTKVNDIANKVRSGKKITKEEYDVLKPLVEKSGISRKVTSKSQKSPSIIAIEETLEKIPDNVNILYKEIPLKKDNDSWYTYKPSIYDTSSIYKNIPKVSVGLNVPEFHGPNLKLFKLSPVKYANIDPYIKYMDNIMKENNIPPLEGGLIFNEDHFPRSSGMYCGSNKSIQIGRRYFDENYCKDKIASNKEYADKNNGRQYTVEGFFDTQEDLLKSTILHELAHHELSSYNKQNGYVGNHSTRGDEEFEKIIESVAKSGWTPPSVYSENNSGELYAECRTLYWMDRKDLLDPKIINYIEKVNNFNKKNKYNV